MRASAWLLTITTLGGCAASLEDCPEREVIVSTKQALIILPDGCRLISSSSVDVARVVCSDGRQGFAVGGL